MASRQKAQQDGAGEIDYSVKQQQNIIRTLRNKHIAMKQEIELMQAQVRTLQQRMKRIDNEKRKLTTAQVCTVQPACQTCLTKTNVPP